MRRQSRVPKRVRARLARARVARLATVDVRGRPHLVPVCFVYDGRAFYTPLDAKPKRVAPRKLARVRNLRAHPGVALLVDDYREDWKRLWYVLVRGRAALLPTDQSDEVRRVRRLLQRKYPQYAAGFLPGGAPLIRIRPDRIQAWGKV